MPVIQPKVSLLIPAYNQQEWIEACVRSALAQTYPNLEVIVSDNASTDHTCEIVKGLLADPRLSYRRNRVNLGRVGNYQRLVHEYATGEYVMVLDGDDMLTNPEYIAAAAALLSSDPDVVLAFGKMLQGTTPETAFVCNDGLDLPRVMDGTGFFLANPPFGRVGLFHLTALYRRQVAIDAQIYSLDLLSVDYAAFYRMILGRRIAFTNEVAGLWRQHGANHSQRYSFEAMQQNFDALLFSYRFAIETRAAEPADLTSWLRTGCAAFYLICLKAALRRAKWMDAIRFTAFVLNLDPLILPAAAKNILLRPWRGVS